MPTARGNGQYLQNLMKAILEVHGLEIGPVTLEARLVDFKALTLSFEQFVEKFTSFFEYGVRPKEGN